MNIVIWHVIFFFLHQLIFYHIMLYYSFSIENIIYIYIILISGAGAPMPPTPGTSWLIQCPGGGGWDTEARGVVAELKHHGSEGQIRPAARSPECQTSLSEPTSHVVFCFLDHLIMITLLYYIYIYILHYIKLN